MLADYLKNDGNDLLHRDISAAALIQKLDLTNERKMELLNSIEQDVTTLNKLIGAVTIEQQAVLAQIIDKVGYAFQKNDW